MKGVIKDIKSGGVRLLIVEDYDSLSVLGAEYLYDQVANKPDSYISIATGDTPLGTYARWIEKMRSLGLSTDRIRIHKLDEWAGVSATDPASCEYFLQDKILKPLGIGEDRYFGVACNTADPAGECRRVAAVMEREPLDLSILGVGVDGHLGLNEAGDELTYETHTVNLAPSSKEHQMLSATERNVEQGLTSGIGEIMAARRILFLVSGKKKQRAFARFMERKITPRLPASFLWLHGDVTCLCDREAAALWLENAK